MDIDLVTVKDLKEFKIELLTDLKNLFLDSIRPESGRQWIKGDEVRKKLRISESKLQKLRIEGLLRSSKIGGTHYYKMEDIEKMLAKNCQ